MLRYPRMKILVVHNTLNSAGGGERVALHAIKALMEAGHKVVLGTVEKTEWAWVLKTIGVKLPELPKEFWITKELRAFGIYQRQLLAMSTSLLRLKGECDIVLNTHGDMMAVPAEITYMHFPTLTFLKGPWSPYTKYAKSLFWRAYFTPYRLLLEANLWTLDKTLLLTNSKFSRSIIEKHLGRNSLVLYPPVEISDYLRSAENERREDAAITIARFTPEKNLHLIPFIAEKLPSVRFYVIGSARGRRSKNYLAKILALKEKLGVKNLELFPNAPHELKLKLLSKSKALLHLMPYEHFGIAVVEGQASGCVPVVHKSGGQWTDVVEEGKYGLGYESLQPEEIVEKVSDAISKWTPEEALALSRHALRFSDSEFRARIAKIVERYVS